MLDFMFKIVFIIYYVQDCVYYVLYLGILTLFLFNLFKSSSPSDNN